jgi:hypothetical protein
MLLPQRICWLFYKSCALRVSDGWRHVRDVEVKANTRSSMKTGFGPTAGRDFWQREGFLATVRNENTKSRFGQPLVNSLY